MNILQTNLQTNVCLIYLYMVSEGKAIVIVLTAPVHQSRGVNRNSPLGLDTPCPHPHSHEVIPILILHNHHGNMIHLIPILF